MANKMSKVNTIRGLTAEQFHSQDLPMIRQLLENALKPKDSKLSTKEARVLLLWVNKNRPKKKSAIIKSDLFACKELIYKYITEKEQKNVFSCNPIKRFFASIFNRNALYLQFTNEEIKKLTSKMANISSAQGDKSPSSPSNSSSGPSSGSQSPAPAASPSSDTANLNTISSPDSSSSGCSNLQSLHNYSSPSTAPDVSPSSCVTPEPEPIASVADRSTIKRLKDVGEKLIKWLSDKGEQVSMFVSPKKSGSATPSPVKLVGSNTPSPAQEGDITPSPTLKDFLKSPISSIRQFLIRSTTPSPVKSVSSNTPSSVASVHQHLTGSPTTSSVEPVGSNTPSPAQEGDITPSPQEIFKSLSTTLSAIIASVHQRLTGSPTLKGQKGYAIGSPGVTEKYMARREESGTVDDVSVNLLDKLDDAAKIPDDDSVHLRPTVSV